ncbi:GNAT family N-acetyltransferase [Alteromonas pelagimontana]|uniref:GNAT family N-acetyltransferase n=1 Tax=Alteromonas pelagimontana TaxID=1858656 RepID=A0A6M4MGU7_9ALTE|nr:GNAT family N-acetyltransferase [Alteromonas pelagimontana]QJR81830.1 GNAT family N-acetyltransferase [Alteromonas pelagimontana]
MITIKQQQKDFYITGYSVHLRPVVYSDLEQLREWRNSAFVSKQMLDSQYISAEQQAAWFMKVSRDDSQYHWIVEYQGHCIGSTNIKARHVGERVHTAKELEPGLYIGDPDYQGNILAFAPTLAMYDFCFNELQTQSFHAVVKATNQAAIKYNQQLGYEIVSQQKLLELSLQKEAYERQTVMLKRLLSRTRQS